MRVAIVLAAGASRRFGRGCKLLAPLAGRALLHHALDRALAAGAGRVLVTVPSGGGRVARLVRRRAGRAGRRLALVVAHGHARGMGASLRAALARVRPIERELLVFLGDMPFAGDGVRLRIPPRHDAARPFAGRTPGHPTLVRTAAARAAIGADDRGLSGRLDPARVAPVPARATAVVDVDTRAALRRAGRRA